MSDLTEREERWWWMTQRELRWFTGGLVLGLMLCLGYAVLLVVMSS